MKMNKKKVGFYIDPELHVQLRDMAWKQRLSQSRLIELWISESYKESNKTSEESKDE